MTLHPNTPQSQGIPTNVEVTDDTLRRPRSYWKGDRD
jgi:hypothetical protein